jgi:hypothetical protein
MVPARVDITLRRNTPFVEDWIFLDEAGRPFDFTGWTGKLEIRRFGAEPGAARISLTGGTGLEGLYFYPGDRTRIRVGIDQPTIAALPEPTQSGGSVALVYDLIMADPSGLKQAFREGTVIVLPGVTR